MNSSNKLREKIEKILYIEFLPDGINLQEWQADQILALVEGIVPDRADGQSPELHGNYFDGYNHCRETMLSRLTQEEGEK